MALFKCDLLQITILVLLRFHNHVRADDEVYTECMNQLRSYCGEITPNVQKCVERAMIHWTHQQDGYLTNYHSLISLSVEPGNEMQHPTQFCYQKATKCKDDLDELTNVGRMYRGQPQQQKLAILQYSFYYKYFGSSNIKPGSFLYDYLRHLSKNLQVIDTTMVIPETYCELVSTSTDQNDVDQLALHFDRILT